MTSTAFTKVEALEELVSDYELWAESLFMIRDKRNELVPLKLNQVQKKIGDIEAEEIRNNGNARLYILKARQGGVSTDQQARNLHKIWGTPGSVALTLAHAREDTDKIFMITRRAVQNFAKGYLPKMGRSEAKEITFPSLDSAFWTGTAGSSRVGRGITITRFHGSEFAFWADPKGTLGSVTPAMIPLGSSIVLETTPDAYDSEAHKFWKASKEGETGYRCVFFPWWECDILYYRLPLMDADELGEYSKEEQALVTAFHLDPEQIKWRRHKIKEMGKSTFLREYPEDDETCWLIAGEKFYDADQLQEMLPLARVRSGKKELQGRLEIFDTPEYEAFAMKDGRQVSLGLMVEEVIIGCDVSEGVGGDRSAWVARAFPSWRLLAQFADKRTPPEELADILNEWGRIYGEAFLVIEKNFHGITVLRRLRDHHKYPKRSIYHRTPLSGIVDIKTDYIGWTTTGESTPLMLDYGRELLTAAHDGLVPLPSHLALLDAARVPRDNEPGGRLNGKDTFVSEILAWVGRGTHSRTRVKVLKPLHW